MGQQQKQTQTNNNHNNNHNKNKNNSDQNCFNSIDFGRFLDSHFAGTGGGPSKNQGASLFKSSDFSDIYQGEERNFDSHPRDEEEGVAPPTYASLPQKTLDICMSQEHIPKLFRSLDWDASRLSPVDNVATAQAVAMQHSFEESILPSPKPVPFPDAFKSQDWSIGDIAPNMQFKASVMDHTMPTSAASPKPSTLKGVTPKSFFTSRDWIASELLGTHEEVSISPAIFQLDGDTLIPPETTATTTFVPSFAQPFQEKTNWESMFIGQIQQQAVAPQDAPAPATKKRKRKKRSKVVPEHKTYVDTTQHDVLLGRGGKSNHHPGNKRYREEVENFRPLYASLTTDEEKTAMSQALVDVMERMGGRFLEEDKIKDVLTNKVISQGWYVVPNIVARRKASQALREDSDPEKRKAKRARFLAKRKALQQQVIY